MVRKKGFKHTEETKRKIGLSNSIVLKGKKLSEESIKKRTNTRKRRKIPSPMKGKKHSLKARQKMSKSQIGHKTSDRTKKKISKSLMGHKGYFAGKKRPEISGKNHVFYGKHRSEETKQKIAESKKGNKSHFWKGGIYKNPYPVDWTKTLKKSIKERDKYLCQVCLNEGGVIHHIDYNKNNNNPNNLITLCRSCHAKTTLYRDYWLKYFKNKLKGET